MDDFYTHNVEEIRQKNNMFQKYVDEIMARSGYFRGKMQLTGWWPVCLLIDGTVWLIKSTWLQETYILNDCRVLGFLGKNKDVTLLSWKS